MSTNNEMMVLAQKDNVMNMGRFCSATGDATRRAFSMNADEMCACETTEGFKFCLDHVYRTAKMRADTKDNANFFGNCVKTFGNLFKKDVEILKVQMQMELNKLTQVQRIAEDKLKYEHMMEQQKSI